MEDFWILWIMEDNLCVRPVLLTMNLWRLIQTTLLKNHIVYSIIKSKIVWNIILKIISIILPLNAVNVKQSIFWRKINVRKERFYSNNVKLMILVVILVLNVLRNIFFMPKKLLVLLIRLELRVVIDMQIKRHVYNVNWINI